MQKVQEGINNLIKLQEIDSKIYRFREEKANKPAQKQQLQEVFSQKDTALKAKQEEATSLQLKRKECEIDLETKEKEIKKYQTQLLQVKTNKEYTALQKQIEGLKADNSVLEDEILQLMEKIDKVKAEIGGEKEQLALEEKKLKEETTKIDQEIKEIDEKITSLEKEKTEASSSIEKGLLIQYERILKAKAGLALVPVVGESCGGCNRVLPPQVVNEARIKDRIINCEFCARLLYWPE